MVSSQLVLKSLLLFTLLAATTLSKLASDSHHLPARADLSVPSIFFYFDVEILNAPPFSTLPPMVLDSLGGNISRLARVIALFLSVARLSVDVDVQGLRSWRHAKDFKAYFCTWPSWNPSCEHGSSSPSHPKSSGVADLAWHFILFHVLVVSFAAVVQPTALAVVRHAFPSSWKTMSYGLLLGFFFAAPLLEWPFCVLVQSVGASVTEFNLVC